MVGKTDRSAFEKEILKHIDSLYNTALRLTRNESSARDLVQDAYLRAVKFWKSFEKGTNSRAWMYKILMNLFYTEYARKEHEREVLDLHPFDPGNNDFYGSLDAPEIKDPESFLLDHIEGEDVMKVMDHLPADFRAVVLLFDLEGMTYREISEVLNIPAGTVMSRLFRARQVLKEKLAKVATDHGFTRSSTDDGDVPSEGTENLENLDDYRRNSGGKNKR